MQIDTSEGSFWQTVERIEHFFDTAADTLDDGTLFAAGYLQGHFAVVVSRLQTTDADAEALNQAMLVNLESAFAAKELEESDQSAVAQLWQEIFHQFR